MLLKNLNQFAISVDQCLNVLIFSVLKPKTAHWADETLSSHAYRLSKAGGPAWPMTLINALFFWQDEHCKHAYESELERSHLPPGMRDAE